jgi:hypothetical protein
MTEEQKKDLDLCLREIEDMGEIVREMIRADAVDMGKVATVRDIVSRFFLPRLEAACAP